MTASDASHYQPPADIWEVDRQLRFGEPLSANDPRYVPTEAARGDFSMSPLMRSLGFDPKSNTLRTEDKPVYALLSGHRGCGKSTELRRLSETLTGPNGFLVILLDASVNLDPNNMRYADVLLALATELFEQLNAQQIEVKQVYLSNLETWFKQRIESHAETQAFAAELRTGAKAKAGIPFLGEVFARVTAAIRTGSTYKSELRQVVQNNFTEFADSFNTLLHGVNDSLRASGKARQLLFVVDGTDRLTGEDSSRLFVRDVNQLQLIKGYFIYCAPIHLLYEGTQLQQVFECHTLPMISIESPSAADDRDEQGYAVMRQLLLRRADATLFDNQTTMERFIQFSGGSPRELLRLLELAFQFSETDRFDAAACDKAIKRLGTDYKRIVESDDYKVLQAIDQQTDQAERNDERVRHLLYNLALLEYNGYWRRSHPAIRQLPAYTLA